VSGFSGDAKDEVAGVELERACCAASFVGALARFSNRRALGRFGVRSDRVIASSERASIARAALRAARHAGVDAHSKRFVDARLGRAEILAVISDAPISALARPPARACCRRAWLRGAFLASGSVADPHRGYHLELFCPDDDAARALGDALALFGIDLGIARRRGRPLGYVKGAKSVADLLGHMGASRSVLTLDDVLAVRATKNAIRRKVNSELANAKRAAVCAARQRDAALRVADRLGLAALTPALREAARLRIAHPSHSLAELAAGARPSITKAAMAARMRTLERLARPGRRR